VFGETLTYVRDAITSDFKAGRIRFLVNVNVLAVGFDAPNIDCVVMLCPTASPVRYLQQVGRGFRTCEGKADCLVLDFAGNVLRHGPVDAIQLREPGTRGGDAPCKQCPGCQQIIIAAYTVCPECGHEFELVKKQRHDAEAGNAPILMGEPVVHDVFDIYYVIHTKKGAGPDTPKTLKVEYQIVSGGYEWYCYAREWVCFDHAGYARSKAVKWWEERSNAPVPNSVAEAWDMANNGALCTTAQVTVRKEGRFDKIVSCQLGPIPDWDGMPTRVAGPMVELGSKDEVPF